ncbi:regulatory signaling modulator protein AmpE [Salinisphaera sp. Q1T1-3]|uniref:regulatory signaling modulator protein AmpE n=1 Tax=Salinisphaera sp. Q1T1-3 TaxID=2321229 RepID=UPI001314F971|nr:regulatory signaling modulator protein AmpE [Salinisphaera sp. Q1T1-3]
MHLIVIVAALLLERTLGQIARLRRLDAFAAYVDLIATTRLGRAWLAHPSGALVILPPVAIVAIAQWQIAVHAWLGVQLLFGLIGLLISLGPRDLWEDVYALANARSQAAHDEVEARAIALARRATGRAPADIHPSTLLGAVLVQGHERVLAVLLWFFVAGPTGALFYRLARELPALAQRAPQRRATARTAEYVHGLAAFIPARLVAVVYALTGQSGCAFGAWRGAIRTTTRLSGTGSWLLLARVGRGALGLPADAADRAAPADFSAMLLAALSLISRSVLVLLALLAAATLLGFAR